MVFKSKTLYSVYIITYNMSFLLHLLGVRMKICTTVEEGQSGV